MVELSRRGLWVGVVYYAVLLFAFALSYVLPHVTSSATPDVLKAITGTVTLLSALGQAVAKVNLRFYLFASGHGSGGIATDLRFGGSDYASTVTSMKP